MRSGRWPPCVRQNKRSRFGWDGTRQLTTHNVFVFQLSLKEKNMNNKLTIQLLAIAIAVLVFSVADASAQSTINLDSGGRASLKATVGANGKYTWRISGKKFTKLDFRQTSGSDLRYELRQESRVMSAGRTKTSGVMVTSDGKSMYSLTIVNNTAKPENIAFSVTNKD